MAGRGPYRPEEQDHPALGQARHPALGASRPAHPIGLHLWRHLPGPRRRRRPGAPQVQHRRHDPSLAGNQPSRCARAHAIVIVDQAGWHLSNDLEIPDNITILPLPPKSPELNPVENVWQFIRDNWLSNRVFTSYNDILDHCCFAWNQLIDQPWRIMSIGLRQWAHQ